MSVVPSLGYDQTEILGNIMRLCDLDAFDADLTYGNGKMAMAKQFSGYWTYGQLTDHYRATTKEAARVLARKGIFVVKCQDIIHNHRMHPTHVSMIAWAEAEGFRLKDLFVLGAKHRLPSPNRKGTQQHARIFHSYFLVFEKR